MAMSSREDKNGLLWEVEMIFYNNGIPYFTHSNKGFRIEFPPFYNPQKLNFSMLAWLVASLHMVTIPYFIFHVTRKCWLKLIQEYITNVVFFDIKLILNMKREEQTFSLSCNYWTVKNRKLKGVKKIEHVQMINCCIYCCCFYFLGPWMS